MSLLNYNSHAATDFIAPSTAVSDLTHSREAADFVSGIQKAAKDASIWVSVGIHQPLTSSSVPVSSSTSSENKRPPRCYNTQLVIDGHGDIISRYRKTHLFDVDIKGGLTILESDTTVPGKQLEPPVASPLGNVGVRALARARVKLSDTCFGSLTHSLIPNAIVFHTGSCSLATICAFQNHRCACDGKAQTY